MNLLLFCEIFDIYRDTQMQLAQLLLEGKSSLQFDEILSENQISVKNPWLGMYVV